MIKSDKELDFVRGILTDIDGTLYFKGAPIPGAIETVSKLREIGIKLIFLTNTDSKVPKTIVKTLQDYGFTINIEEVFTPIIAIKEFLSNYPDKKSYLVSTKEVEMELHDFPQIKGSEKPDFVVISDFHDDWDVYRLNEAFKYVFKGAELLGTQGNKYYLDRNGEPVIDTGSFVQMIASAAKVAPKIFGKPSVNYFHRALKKINLTPNETIVIGDDLESDIEGAINAGIKGVLVRTGKGQFLKPSQVSIKPYKIIDSFSSILKFF